MSGGAEDETGLRMNQRLEKGLASLFFPDPIITSGSDPSLSLSLKHLG